VRETRHVDLASARKRLHTALVYKCTRAACLQGADIGVPKVVCSEETYSRIWSALNPKNNSGVGLGIKEIEHEAANDSIITHRSPIASICLNSSTSL
jgi:hypothetical protein